LRHPVTDIALLAYIARKNAKVVSYTEATRACKSSSSASRALHQLIREGLLEPKPKLLGLRYVTQYVVTQKGKQVADLALQLSQLREAAAKTRATDEQLMGDAEDQEIDVEEVKSQGETAIHEEISEQKPTPRQSAGRNSKSKASRAQADNSKQTIKAKRG
jgi:DNA-binding MarR family transcriptional regulator